MNNASQIKANLIRQIIDAKLTEEETQALTFIAKKIISRRTERKKRGKMDMRFL